MTWVYFDFGINGVVLVNLDTEAEYREIWDQDGNVYQREYL